MTDGLASLKSRGRAIFLAPQPGAEQPIVPYSTCNNGGEEKQFMLMNNKLIIYLNKNQQHMQPRNIHSF